MASHPQIFFVGATPGAAFNSGFLRGAGGMIDDRKSTFYSEKCLAADSLSIVYQSTG